MEEVKQIFDHWGEKEHRMSSRSLWMGTTGTRPPLLSAADMNMTAMSKRRTLARFLRICSTTVGASFLQRTAVILRIVPASGVFSVNSLDVEVAQRLQDQIENVRLQGGVEDGGEHIWIHLLQDDERDEE